MRSILGRNCLLTKSQRPEYPTRVTQTNQTKRLRRIKTKIAPKGYCFLIVQILLFVSYIEISIGKFAFRFQLHIYIGDSCNPTVGVGENRMTCLMELPVLLQNLEI